jgi:hypothetical protein
MRMIKLRTARLAGHAARIGAKSNACRILVGKPEGHKGSQDHYTGALVNHTQGCPFRKVASSRYVRAILYICLSGPNSHTQQVRAGTDEASQWRHAGKVSCPLHYAMKTYGGVDI